MIRRVVVAALALGLVGVGVSSAQAQAKKPPLPKGTPVTLNGKVDQVVPQGLLIDAAGKKYAMVVMPGSTLSVTGTATADFLGPGAFVQFDVELDSADKPKGEVTKIQITEQSSLNVPGIFNEAGPDAVQGQGGKYFVRGTVKTNKNGQLTVQAGPKPITVQVSGAAAIPVTFSDWRMASVGDSVTGSAIAGQANPQFTPIVAENVTIKAAMPFQKKKGR